MHGKICLTIKDPQDTNLITSEVNFNPEQLLIASDRKDALKELYHVFLYLIVDEIESYDDKYMDELWDSLSKLDGPSTAEQ